MPVPLTVPTIGRWVFSERSPISKCHYAFPMLYCCNRTDFCNVKAAVIYQVDWSAWPSSIHFPLPTITRQVDRDGFTADLMLFRIVPQQIHWQKIRFHQRDINSWSRWMKNIIDRSSKKACWLVKIFFVAMFSNNWHVTSLWCALSDSSRLVFMSDIWFVWRK